MNSSLRFYANGADILNLFIDENLSENEQNLIISTIYDMIHDKEIEKDICGRNLGIKWRVLDEKNLLQYYTHSSELLADEGIHMHTQKVLNDIREIVGKNKFSFIITKSITKKVCMI